MTSSRYSGQYTATTASRPRTGLLSVMIGRIPGPGAPFINIENSVARLSPLPGSWQTEPPTRRVALGRSRWIQ